MATLTRRRSIEWCNLWVCQCCMLEHGNGECCADDSHGGDGVAPWSAFDFARFSVTMGLLRKYHEGGCLADEDCDCERESFGRWPCSGCGSGLAGERFAFTMWREQQRFDTGVLPA